MADYTVPGIIGIVALVLIAALILNPQPPASGGHDSGTLAGAAYTSVNAQSCQPARFCAGSKLTMVRSDCSVAYAFCKYGCMNATCQ